MRGTGPGLIWLDGRQYTTTRERASVQIKSLLPNTGKSFFQFAHERAWYPHPPAPPEVRSTEAEVAAHGAATYRTTVAIVGGGAARRVPLDAVLHHAAAAAHGARDESSGFKERWRVED